MLHGARGSGLHRLKMKLNGVLLLSLASSIQAASFVENVGGQLFLDGEPWYYLGVNAYWLMPFAGPSQRPLVDSFFQSCNDAGLKVVRIWAFNKNCPKSPGVYDTNEMEAFDYIVSTAGKYNIRLIMALGNSWTAYRSPEDFMRMAGVDPSGKTLLDFYESQAVKDVFKGHMNFMTSRVNTFNGVAYKDDPTIMLWDVFNEPRCPGCQSASQQQTVKSWLQDMSATLKSYAPKQLVAAGTEGYFMDDAHVRYNPGAGAQCEGEDWVAINRISSLDVTTVHIYDRQMELVPPTWREPTFEDLLNWMQNYLSSHISVAESLGKPLIVEEFNILKPKFTDSQRAQVFQLFYDMLSYQRTSGGVLSGVMFWNGAIGGQIWDDGFNVYIDSASVPAVPMPRTSSVESLGSQKAAAAPARPAGSGIGALAIQDGSLAATQSAGTPRAPVYINTEGLDAFRRGPQRAECAEAAATWWLPLWTEQWARTVDVSSLQSRTQGKSVLDIIKKAASEL